MFDILTFSCLLLSFIRSVYESLKKEKFFSTCVISCSFMLNRVNFKTYKSFKSNFFFFMIGFSATRIFLTQLMYTIICINVNTSDLQCIFNIKILWYGNGKKDNSNMTFLAFPLDYLLFNICVMISYSCKVPSDKNRISSSSISAW